MSDAPEKLSTRQRLAIEQQTMPERDAGERKRDICEVPMGFAAAQAVVEATRCLECKDQPCVSGCPVGIDIPGFMALLRGGDFQGAIDRIREANCLPAVTGRVCPQETQCQAFCKVAGIKKDALQAVSVGALERFLADWEREKGVPNVPEIPAPTGKSVAVVGSGPAGLTVAGDLRKLGHRVRVFEAFHKMGGVLVYGIPEFRLPKNIVQYEVDYLTSLGVEFEPNVVVGMTVSLDELLGEEGYDAVFVGTGAGLASFMNLPGETLIGVYSANEYLTRANLMQAFTFPLTDTPTAQSRRVVVIGGGNVAMDSARTAIRLGAEKVSLIYRRSREEMPARAEEVHHGEQEGIEFLLLNNPVEFLGDDSGHVRAVRVQRMELGEPDASGRRRPVSVKGSEWELEVDTVVEAIGNYPNRLLPDVTPDLAASKYGNIVADPETGQTSKRGVFAGGDAVLGAATVILAMGEGRKAAKAIDAFLRSDGC